MSRLCFLVLCWSLALPSQAATFPLFGPANGVLVGNASSPQTTAATAANIVALWSGCVTNEYLNQSGTCDLVSLTASVTGTLPVANGGTGVTSLGNITRVDDTNVTLTLGGTPTGAVINSTSFTLGWSGTLAASRGGLGMSTVTDDTVAVANGSTWQSKALTDCDSTNQAVTYDTTTNAWGCATITGATFANPSATIGLSATNGVATTAMRSDAAPALSQSIVPTWSGKHTYTNVSGGAWQITTAAPEFRLLESDATANEGLWSFAASGDHLTFAAYNDAVAAFSNWLDVDRSGVSISDVEFGNATSNPTYTFAGTGAVTSGGVYRASAGAIGAPSFSFSGDSDTGLWTDGTPGRLNFAGDGTSMGVMQGGVLSMAAGVRVADGVAGTPSVAFSNDSDTGLFTNAGDSLAFAAGSTFAGAIRKIATVPQLTGTDGTASEPYFTFHNDPNSGLFRANSDTVSVSTGGILAGTFGVDGAGGAALYLPAGSAALPSLSYIGDGDTGLYLSSNDQPALTAGGVVRMFWNSASTVSRTPFYASDGTASAPGVAFENDPDTGVYRAGANDLRIHAGNGTGGLQVTATAVRPFGLPVRADAGTASDPTYSFDSDPDSGMYRKATNQIGLSSGGVEVAVVNQGAQFSLLNGSAGTPALGFIGDTDVGLYSAGADSVGIATGGTNRATVSNSGVIVGAPTGGAQGNGTINATGLYINGVSVGGGATQTGTFSPTFTGFGSAPSCTMKWRKTGSQVSLFVDGGGTCTATSNATGMSITNIPAAIIPASNASVVGLCTDGGADYHCLAVFTSSGSAVFYRDGAGTGYSSTGFSGAGTKGITTSVFIYDRRD